MTKWIEYLVLFEDENGKIHDSLIEATDEHMARDVMAEMMSLQDIDGLVIEVTLA